MGTHDLDPWAGGPRRGVFVTQGEAADPVLRRAAHSDPAREWVTISPEWLRGVVEALAGLQDDVVAGEADPADVCTVLQLAAADLYAVAAGYPGAGAVDLTDPALAPSVASFLARVLDMPAPMMAELLPGWGEALAEALEREP